jgi:hypothetical protein
MKLPRFYSKLILLVLLQAVIIGLFFWITLTSQLQIVQDLQGIVEPLAQANYNTVQLEEGGAFVDDPIAIVQSFQSLKRNLLIFIAEISALFLLGGGILWGLTLQRVRKISMQKQVTSYVISSIIIFSPFFILSYFEVKRQVFLSVDPSHLVQVVQNLGILFAIFYYFALVAFALPFTNWKEFTGNVYKVSIKKIHRVLPVLILNLAVLGTLLVIMNYLLSFPKYTMPLVAVGLLFIVLLVYGRTRWVKVVNESNN